MRARMEFGTEDGKGKKGFTCIAMISGSRVATNLENSGQLFLARRRKLLAFHVKNFKGSFPVCFSSSSTSPLVERAGFFEDPSFSSGLKNRFKDIPLFPLPASKFALQTPFVLCLRT